MTSSYLLGYDPGGEHAHGLALCEVEQVDGRWCPRTLQVATASSVCEGLAWVEAQTQGARLLAVGLDTLTARREALAARMNAFIEAKSGVDAHTLPPTGGN